MKTLEKCFMEREQKVAYLKALIYLATADDKIESEERTQFAQLGVLYGLTANEIQHVADSVIKKEEPIEVILAAITDRPTKLLLMYDLLAICYTDNSYSLAERNTLRTITGMLGIEENKLSAMEAVMMESVALQAKINTILEK